MRQRVHWGFDSLTLRQRFSEETRIVSWPHVVANHAPRPGIAGAAPASSAFAPFPPLPISFCRSYGGRVRLCAPLVKREHVRPQNGYDRARHPGGAPTNQAGVGQRQTASPVKRRCAFESRRRLTAVSAQPVSCRFVKPVMVVRVHPPQPYSSLGSARIRGRNGGSSDLSVASG